MSSAVDALDQDRVVQGCSGRVLAGRAAAVRNPELGSFNRYSFRTWVQRN